MARITSIMTAIRVYVTNGVSFVSGVLVEPDAVATIMWVWPCEP